MGVVRISTFGSFPTRERSFAAEDFGHAQAVAAAIAWLASEVLPAAIAQDHRLAAEGATPGRGWDALIFPAVPGSGPYIDRRGD